MFVGMYNARKTSKTTSNNPTNKSSPTMSKEKLSDPPKNCINESSIFRLYLSLHDNVNIDNAVDQIGIYLRETTKLGSTNFSLDNNIPAIKVSSDSGKRSNASADHFDTCLNVNSLEGFKIQKYLKATNKDPIQ